MHTGKCILENHVQKTELKYRNKLTAIKLTLKFVQGSFTLDPMSDWWTKDSTKWSGSSYEPTKVSTGSFE